MEVCSAKENAKVAGEKKKLFRRRKYVCSDTKCGCVCACVTITAILIMIMILSSWAQTFSAKKFTNVEYEANGIKLHAYLAKPASPKNNTPAVIIFHTWSGISEVATYFADRLAEEGYYAIAPDLFRGVASKSNNIIANILMVLFTPQGNIDQDAEAAWEYVKSLPNVDKDRIASGPGFCFGGSQSLIFASRHSVAATVTCYGTYITELDEPGSKAWGKLKSGGPVLGIYGQEDTRPKPDEAKQFAAALKVNKIDHNVTIYEGVGHGFITPESYKDSNHEHHQTTKTAWNQIEGFLRRAFDKSNGVSRRSLSARENTEAKPYKVPLDVSLYHRFSCALKCSQDYFTHTGHWNAENLEPHASVQNVDFDKKQV